MKSLVHQLWDANSDPLHLSTKDSQSIMIPCGTRSAGSGGFCDLFLGIFCPRGLVLAMKRPRFSTQDQKAADKAKRRFKREARIWHRLSHANILPFYGLVEMADEIYLVSPWIAYGDLAKFVSARLDYLALPPEIRCRNVNHEVYSRYRESDIILGIASGLTYLHKRNVIHGDIKALNVLLDDKINPLLCDFGMTKDNNNTSASSSLWAGAGTWRWMSPEMMLDNAARKTAPSDMYAFSMTIVEILTGATPFPHLNYFNLAQEVINGTRPERRPLERQGQNFDKLWKVAAASWNADPEQRPSAEDIVNRLRPEIRIELNSRQ